MEPDFFTVDPQPVGQFCPLPCLTVSEPQEEKVDTSCLFPRCQMAKDAEATNCFLIHLQIIKIPSWLLQMVDTVLVYSTLTFVLFWVFIDIVTVNLKSHSKMANLTLSGPRRLPEFSKVKTEALCELIWC